MKPDPDHDEYIRLWSELYEKKNYDSGIAGYMLKKSHIWAESKFNENCYFKRVLEVGAGSGVHVRFVRHRFDEYVMSDSNPHFNVKPQSSASGTIAVAREDATRLSFSDNSFDRVIATHVLEHLVHPHSVLREWWRVVKPGGVLSLVLPCDPGVAWRLGRAVGSRGKFVRAGLEYDYWMAREHVNSINNLVALLRYYFDDLSEQWLPFRIPSMDLNLFYIAHLRKS
jgi:SAM-dependent methyltransferase